MHAKPGDWLVVENRTVGGAVRRGLIEEVHSPDGSPPYLVHWSDDGHRALTFPGPDAYVLTGSELRAQEEVAAGRFSSMQHQPSHLV
ncbi:DUF1918 domain-containing protein [Nocardia rhizosphaerihabitans]|uniref:DUF1918 domain-containing protein n=1 Tax=Nocardia rhizosphaerihabitans TaxID=1691570 RepID=A0ABQ2KFA8_9NOCA|nr:DUF1918 domain-containing protein [Nocardia rhizosphaerihabitans]GGN79489.1 hypothetical protein GCM10011610_27920 [Nocardia rhizosphaerihabitans]